MVGNNSLSGSSNPEFAWWWGIDILSIEQNPIDWDLELLYNFTLLKRISMEVAALVPPRALCRAVLCTQGCRIGGTLPQAALSTNVEVLLLSNNIFSGTLSTTFLASPNLQTVTLSGGRCAAVQLAPRLSDVMGRLSGTLSDELATSMWSLSAFLANDLRLSGTLPQQRTSYQIVSSPNNTCDWITNIDECSIAAASLGVSAASASLCWLTPDSCVYANNGYCATNSPVCSGARTDCTDCGTCSSMPTCEAPYCYFDAYDLLHFDPNTVNTNGNVNFSHEMLQWCNANIYTCLC